MRRQITGWLWMNEWKGGRKKVTDPTWNSSSALRRDLEKSWRSSVRIQNFCTAFWPHLSPEQSDIDIACMFADKQNAPSIRTQREHRVWLQGTAICDIIFWNKALYRHYVTMTLQFVSYFAWLSQLDKKYMLRFIEILVLQADKNLNKQKHNQESNQLKDICAI